jgi:hypothetical protein
VATRLRAICHPRALLVSQRLLLCTGTPALSGKVAPLAPTSSIALRAIVKDGLAAQGGPDSGTRMTDIAGHAGAAQQICLVGDVLGRLHVRALRIVRSAVTGSTWRRGNHSVVHGPSGKASDIRVLVALIALNRRGARNMGRLIHHHSSAGTCVALEAIIRRCSVMLEDRRTPRCAR